MNVLFVLGLRLFLSSRSTCTLHLSLSQTLSGGIAPVRHVEVVQEAQKSHFPRLDNVPGPDADITLNVRPHIRDGLIDAQRINQE